MIQSAGALYGAVFTAGQRHRAVVADRPGRVGPAGVIYHATALQLQSQREHGQVIREERKVGGKVDAL